MKNYVLADFGSTFTKVDVVSEKEKRLIYGTQRPSTVSTDATIALKECLDEIQTKCGSKVLKGAEYYASSSAAGGLRMAVVGITKRLSVSAGKNVAYGAGAKILDVKAGKLTALDIQKMEALPLELILLCGGYENGAEKVIIHNAKRLANSKMRCSVIYGGNSKIASIIRSVFASHQKDCFVVPNIIPNVGELKTKAAEKIIRDLFMNRIINMKGLGEIRKVFKTVTPTPAAVLQAGNLLAKGTDSESGLGNMMMVDVGGATTDVYSYIPNMPGKGARLVGAPEPYAKRTVEGDLGMRESSDTLLQETDPSKIAADIGITKDELIKRIDFRTKNHDFVAKSLKEKRIDQVIAEFAVHTAVRRHCGRVIPVHSSNIKKELIGKNLTSIRLAVATGGPVINSLNPKEILHQVIDTPNDRNLLLPKKVKFILDKDYIIYAVGLLSFVNRDLAIQVFKNSHDGYLDGRN